METSHCLKSKPVPTYTSRVFFAPLGSKKGCKDSLTGSAFPKKNGIALKKTDRDDNVETPSPFTSHQDKSRQLSTMNLSSLVEAVCKMQYSGVLLTLVCSILLCEAHTNVHYSSSKPCKSDHTCEYAYSLEMDQFTVHEGHPMTVTAMAQITCESSGSYGSLDATRYCMTVTEVGGNFLSFGRNQTNDAEPDLSPIQGYAEEKLSGWFCFVQTSEGQVVAVFHSRTENMEAVNFKKGIAAAFQANFRGTAEEVEVDPTSKHFSHYNYVNSSSGSIKMHRVFTNEDVIEYPVNVPAEDVELFEEEDIEYRDGTLVKSNGTMHISVEKHVSPHKEDIGADNKQDADISKMLNAHGTFVMELKVCRLVPLAARRRRNAVREFIDSDSSSEESLMATFDQEKIDMEMLDELRQHLQTPEQVVAAIHNINSSEVYKTLAQIMVLEQKYESHGPTLVEQVLNYLDEISDKDLEEYESERLSIYSLLSTESGFQAQNALIERLQSKDISDVERSSLLVAIAFLPSPSSELIQTLEHMIVQSDETTPLLLVYGALVANVDPDKELVMVSFLIEQIPKNTGNSSQVLVHVLHALGNTQSLLVVEHIIQYTQHDDKDVRLTAITALRLFTHMPSVQLELLYALGNFTHSADMASSIIDALRDGYNQNKKISFNQDLIELLVNVTIDVGYADVRTELFQFFNLVGSPEMLALIRTRDFSSRRKRATTYWPSTYSPYSVISSSYERAQDVIDFPYNRGYLWSYSLGKTSGTYKFYIQAAAGAFAGRNNDCEFKAFGKAVIRGHAFGRESDIVNVMGLCDVRNTAVRRKVYAKFGYSTVLDIDQTTATTFSLYGSLPTYRRTLFSYSVTFTVWIVPVTLSVNLEVYLGGYVYLNGDLVNAEATVTPSATVSLSASVSVSILIARAGLSLSGYIRYSIITEMSLSTCIYSSSAGIAVYDEWSSITFTLSAWAQARRITWRGITWGTVYSWDIVRWPISSSGGRRLLYSSST